MKGENLRSINSNGKHDVVYNLTLSKTLRLKFTIHKR